MRHFIVLFLALTGCLTYEELTDEVAAIATTPTSGTDDPGLADCPPLPPTLPPHVDGDTIVAEPEERVAEDWIEAFMPDHGHSIRATE